MFPKIAKSLTNYLSETLALWSKWVGHILPALPQLLAFLVFFANQYDSVTGYPYRRQLAFHLFGVMFRIAARKLVRRTHPRVYDSGCLESLFPHQVRALVYVIIDFLHDAGIGSNIRPRIEQEV